MGELLLGTRRSSRAFAVLKRGAISAALLAGVALVAVLAFRRATYYPVPRGALPADALQARDGRLTLGTSSLERKGELWVLRLEGEPYAIGAAHAILLGDRSASAATAIDRAILGEREPGSWVGRLRRDAKVRWRFRLLADGIPAIRRGELAGLAAGLARLAPPIDGSPKAPPSYQRLVWRQAAPDVGTVPGSALPFGATTSGLAFVLPEATAPAKDTRQGAQVNPAGEGAPLVLGRIFSLTDAPAPGAPVVFFVKPAGGIAFAGVGWGGQVGVVTGVNAEGLAIAVNPTVSDDMRPTAALEPTTLLARDVLEQAGDIDQAVALIRQGRPLGAASFLVADRDDRRAVIVERSPGRTVILRDPGPLAATPLLQAPEFTKDAENNRARRAGADAERTDRLLEILRRRRQSPPPEHEAAVAGGAPTPVAAAVAVLRDARGPADAEVPRGNGTTVDDVDAAHAVVIDLTAGWLWVAESPGTAGRFIPFDLDAELRGQQPRLAPEPIAPSPGVDPTVVSRLRMARAESRHAARQLRAGNRAGAAEASARATSLAPDLAQPYKLTGDLARAAGRDDEARTAYRRFLDLHPADRGAVEEAKASLGGP